MHIQAILTQANDLDSSHYFQLALGYFSRGY
jgi:hypothetical protein